MNDYKANAQSKVIFGKFLSTALVHNLSTEVYVCNESKKVISKTKSSLIFMCFKWVREFNIITKELELKSG